MVPEIGLKLPFAKSVTYRFRKHPIVVTIAVLLLLLVANYRLVFHGLGLLLERDDELAATPVPALVLMGDQTAGRAKKTFELYEQGKISRIVVAETVANEFVEHDLQVPTWQTHVAMFKTWGVPDHKIDVMTDCKASSTLEEAECLQDYWRASGLTAKPVIVTSWYHTSRAGWLFEQVFPDNVIMVSAPLEGMGPDAWWLSEYSFIQVYNELLKWLYWLIRL